MGWQEILSQKKRDAAVIKKEIRVKHKGKPANVLTPPEKDEIMLNMAEALGFYEPAP